MERCKYYNKHIDTIKKYISCLYSLDDGNCCTGGLLHIVTDDGNLNNNDIEFCLNLCNENPEREESQIGKLICEELLKLSMEQRRLVYNSEEVVDILCYGHNGCSKCPIHNEHLEFWT